MNIEDLIIKRKKFVEIQKENNFDLTNLLVGLYSDESHFILELLQNAEDVKANEIEFILDGNKLTVVHDGAPFNSMDIEGITSISNLNNEKKENLETIGKFGIGFKSVFAITLNPRIQSGNYDFEIVDFIVPHNFTDNNNYKKTTITFPLAHKSKTIEEITLSLKDKFANFASNNILFLNNLNSITFITNENTYKIAKEKRKLLKNETSVVTININDNTFNYLFLEESVKDQRFSKLKNIPRVAIAFPLVQEADSIILQKVLTAKAYAYFETGYETFLNFLIQAPFNTTPARDNLLVDDDINTSLIDQLTLLLTNSFNSLIEMGYFNLNFIELLPIDNTFNSRSKIYSAFYNTLKEKLLQGNYLPIVGSKDLRSANEVILVRGKELTNLISLPEDLFALFGRRYWLPTDITVDRTPVLREYLINELKIIEVSAENFARQVTNEFLKTKDNHWFGQLYGFLNNRQENLWKFGQSGKGILNSKAYIRLSDGGNEPPFNYDNVANFYLPVEGLKYTYKTIHHETILSDEALEFIQGKLQIKRPNTYDEINKHILPLYFKNKDKPDIATHLDHFKLIIAYYDKADSNARVNLIQSIKNEDTYFFQTVDSEGSDSGYNNTRSTYKFTPDLRQYFKTSEIFVFINNKIYQNFNQQLFDELIEDCGIVDTLKIYSFDPKFSWQTKHDLALKSVYKDGSITSDKIIKDRNIDGLPEFLKLLNNEMEQSILLWNLIILSLNKFKDKTFVFKGVYQWYRYSERSTNFDSELICSLRNAKWLYTKNFQEPKIPSEIFLKDLDEKFLVQSDAAWALVNALGFKSDLEQKILESMPLEKREKYEQFEELYNLSMELGTDLNEIIEQFRKQAEENKDRDIINEFNVENLNISEEPFTAYNNSLVTVKVQNKFTDSDDSTPDVSVKFINDNNILTGERGEKIAFHKLKLDWIKNFHLLSESKTEIEFTDNNGDDLYKITLLNDNDKQGHGCDIIISQNDKIIKYIEVKSTVTSNRELFSISGYQWALAHKLFNQGMGDSYSIFVVKNVNSDTPNVIVIENPIKKWRDGYLKVTPVNFEL